MRRADPVDSTHRKLHSGDTGDTGGPGAAGVGAPEWHSWIALVGACLLFAGCGAWQTLPGPSLSPLMVTPEPQHSVTSLQPQPSPTDPCQSPDQALRKASIPPITMEIIPQFDPAPDAEAGDLHLLLRLTAQEVPDMKRPPLDLAVVLDRSGSMAGDKLRAAKQAALELMKQLGPGDMVTLISYDDRVVAHVARRSLDAEGYEAVRSAILGLKEGGSTALGPALISALTLLEGAERGERMLAHVTLLSDGLANVGETRPAALGSRAAAGFSHGISVSTLGVGLDYNEDLMTRLADMGGGRYHYIRNSDAIVSVLNDEFAGLSATVAREISLEIQAPAGITVSRVYGYPEVSENGQTHIQVGALRGGRTIDMVLRLSRTRPSSPWGPIRSSLRFRDVLTDGSAVTAFASVAVRSSADATWVHRCEQTEVTVRVAEVESADQVDAAARAVDAGEFDRARDLLQSSLETVKEHSSKTRSPRLDAQVVELQKALEGVDRARSSTSDQKEFTKSQKSKSYQLKK